MKGVCLLLSLVAITMAQDYCQLNCGSNPHTLCRYSSPVPASTCNKVVSNTLSQEDKDAIVLRHNQYRAKVARGLEKRGNPGPQPAASNMKRMSWDEELAKVAQRWANQCQFRHDACRNVERYAVGQNIAQKSTSAVNTYPITDYVDMWYEEVVDFDARQVPHVTNFNKVGHYTQLVWANSDKIGCGVMRNVDGGWNTTTLVCNYGPAGNYIGAEMYKIK